MKQVRKRLTYANVMSSLAVFLVLGGGAAVAAKTVLPKNSVGAKQIKKNAVTAAKIKKNAITTAKLKNNAVTGAKINEATLGPVPNATNATNAINAENATNWSRYKPVSLVKASHGQTPLLFSYGPFSIYGKCIDAGGGESRAYTFMTTSQPSSSMSSSEHTYNQADFDPGDEALTNYSITSSQPETNESYGGYYGAWTAHSADGSVRLSGHMYSAVNYFGSQCSFWGDVTIH